eukprot:2751783-Rhodomonas_salina.2
MVCSHLRGFSSPRAPTSFPHTPSHFPAPRTAPAHHHGGSACRSHVWQRAVANEVDTARTVREVST